MFSAWPGCRIRSSDATPAAHGMMSASGSELRTHGVSDGLMTRAPADLSCMLYVQSCELMMSHLHTKTWPDSLMTNKCCSVE